MTTITRDRGDIRVLTVDQRAAFLREIAEHVNDERRFRDKPFTDVLHGLIPALASASCVNPVAVFDQLVDAVAELARFDGDERGYSDLHGLGTHEIALVNTRDRLTGEVDAALQALLGAGA